MANRDTDKLGGRGPAQPLADLGADTEADYDTTGATADTTGHGLPPRSTDPVTGRGADTGPIPAAAAPIPTATPRAARMPTAAGSHGKTGMADADLDPATGGFGDMGAAGSASPSRSRERTAVYGTDTEPLAGGSGRPGRR